MRLFRSPYHIKPLLPLLILLLPAASSASDLKTLYQRVFFLRDAYETASEGLSDPVRENAHRLIQEDINPLLDRVDLVLQKNIHSAFELANQLLSRAETLLRNEIDHASNEAHKLLDTFRRDSIALLTTLDNILDKELCKLAPTGSGLLLRTGFSPQPDQATVLDPAHSICWSDFDEALGEPPSALFSGWAYYWGMICEVQQRMATHIQPSDPNSIRLVSNMYSKLASLASQGFCAVQQTDPKRAKTLATWKQSFVEQAVLFQQLGDGTASILH